METAASVAGLVAVAAKTYSILHQFTSDCIDAPSIATEIRDEVRDFQYTLKKLQPYAQQPPLTKLLDASPGDTSQLSLVLTTCSETPPKLQQQLDLLAPSSRMNTLHRVRWVFAQATMAHLVQLLQSHKTSLTLILTIWQSESSTETKERIRRLNEQLSQVIGHLPQHVQPPMVTPTASARLSPAASVHQSPSATINTNPNVNPKAVTSAAPHFYQREFEHALFTSRPYHGLSNTSGLSSLSQRRKGTSWSAVSGGSNTSVYSLLYSSGSRSSAANLKAAVSSDSTSFSIQRSGLRDVSWLESCSDKSSCDSSHGRGVIPRESASAGISAKSSTLSNAISGEIPPIARFPIAILPQRAPIPDWTPNKLSVPPESFSINKALPLTPFPDNTHTQVVPRADRCQTVVFNVHRSQPPIPPCMNGDDLVIGRFLQPSFLSTVDSLLNQANEGNWFKVESMLAETNVIAPLMSVYGKLLHIAVEKGKKRIVKLLLDQGVDPETEDPNGQTPLHHAAWGVSTSIVRLLLARSAHVDPTDHKHCTPLHYAASKSGGVTSGVLKVLLDHGADINAKQRRGYTPLHVAVEMENYDNVAYLLECTVATSVINKSGESPFDLARRKGYDQILKLLAHKELMANTSAPAEGTQDLTR